MGVIIRRYRRASSSSSSGRQLLDRRLLRSSPRPDGARLCEAGVSNPAGRRLQQHHGHQVNLLNHCIVSTWQTASLPADSCANGFKIFSFYT
jgi:hypothetical protein